jgi:hypothetical protein
MRFLVRFCRLLPRALDAAHLRWALEEIDPLHRDVPYILRRLSELEQS